MNTAGQLDNAGDGACKNETTIMWPDPRSFRSPKATHDKALSIVVGSGAGVIQSQRTTTITGLVFVCIFPNSQTTPGSIEWTGFGWIGWNVGDNCRTVRLPGLPLGDCGYLQVGWGYQTSSRQRTYQPKHYPLPGRVIQLRELHATDQSTCIHRIVN